MQRSVIERVAVLAALTLVLAVNWLANALPLGGVRTGEVSALYASYFTPASSTFAIWGVIYTGLLLYAVYQAFPGRRGEANLALIGRLFVTNCLLNAAWLFAWHYQAIALSLILMLCVLATLVLVYRHLSDTSLLVRIPFTMYLAWICVATLANISALQTSLELNDTLLSHVHWTLGKLALAGAVGAAVCLLRRDFIFVLVVAWAAYGIARNQLSVPEIHGAALAVAALGILLAAFTLIRAIMRRDDQAV